MGRILAIDYGTKRTGFAVTDPLKIIASSLETVQTNVIMKFIKEYVQKEDVEHFVIGLPKGLDGKATDNTKPTQNFGKKLAAEFPNIPITYIDERFTSKMAEQSMISGGMKKKDRKVKGNVDKISAAIILQSFLDQNSF
ncbi:Holliday junction resolvase RuvX [Flammeovirga yaeyamensis]|uniref:Putative pre-16S rRNA nuclease n=1 Tax=Flammeovirga yaeyamensis TaxID=367791 RepID=A0AAX1N9C5_9BACT|nr:MULTISPECIES: Holliday junction resolvase RuvX [Flammeovirga]ANQ48766.1 Holliday junction resolvase RuvX [Flammeovirga sp. MY04]MBB3698846.1 putative Holliday junction resolvase [Flammeovirga yaeyamensis]NMF37431.1 Holliday junction resolvase RuvX [Flammeovirga yaeyamensis]QWG03756.1 Holliday junction resolvase RuvX [Flammeovirga yaeyamensis]